MSTLTLINSSDSYTRNSLFKFGVICALKFGLLGAASVSAEDDFFMYSAQDEGGAATCDESNGECGKNWEASVEFGYVAVTGNQDTTSLNARFSLSYEIEKWRHEGFVSQNSSSTEENISGVVVETEAEKTTAQAKSDYKFSEKGYAFGIIDYDDTKDSGFDYQASAAVGVGYRFFKDKKHTLDGEVGVGTRRSKTEIVPSETNSESISRIAGKYVWKISENSKFEQKLSTEIGDDNTITRSFTGLTANIIENLAMKFSYTVKDQTEVPVGNEETETITAFTVVYSF